MTYRLTYEDGDELMRLALPEEPEWALLRRVSIARLAARTRAGAIAITMPEAAIVVTGATVVGGGPDATVAISAEDERLDSPARAMVQVGNCTPESARI